jgi:hypothetical protein
MLRRWWPRFMQTNPNVMDFVTFSYRGSPRVSMLSSKVVNTPELKEQRNATVLYVFAL